MGEVPRIGRVIAGEGNDQSSSVLSSDWRITAKWRRWGSFSSIVGLRAYC